MNFMRLWEDLSPWSKVGITFVVALGILAIIGALVS
jgi:hypothetical protein